MDKENTCVNIVDCYIESGIEIVFSFICSD